MMDSPPLKLIDFEISKLNKASTIEMWTVTGSLFYKAPEMFCGSYDRKVDIWAVGIVAYELLHGHPPFMRDYVDETIQDICNTDIEHYIRPDLSPFAQEFLKKCLNKSPEGRLTSKAALKQPFILQACNTSVTPK
jgi:calcium-dependent protein kinase